MMLSLGNTHWWAPYKQHGTKSTWWVKREHDRHSWCHDRIPAERPTWISKRYTGDGAEIDAFPICCPMQLGLKRGRSSDISLTMNVNRRVIEVLINLICYILNIQTAMLPTGQISYTRSLHITDFHSLERFIPVIWCRRHWLVHFSKQSASSRYENH